jgi:hypothetical protein
MTKGDQRAAEVLVASFGALEVAPVWHTQEDSR